MAFGRSSSGLHDPLQNRTLPIVLFIGLVVFIGLRFESMRGIEAVAAAALFPLLAVGKGLGELRQERDKIAIVGWVIAALAVILSEVFLAQVVLPSKPLAEAQISPSHPEASLALSDQKQVFEVEARGSLGEGQRAAEAHYALSLARGTQSALVEGVFSRTVGKAGGRALRGGPSTPTVSNHEVDRHEVTLAASGPVQVTLKEVKGAVNDQLTVAVYALPLALRWVLGGWGVLVLGALVIQTLAYRQGLRPKLSPAVLMSGLFSVYVVHYYDPDDPLMTISAAIIVALIVGSLGGALLSLIPSKVGIKKRAGA